MNRPLCRTLSLLLILLLLFSTAAYAAEEYQVPDITNAQPAEAAGNCRVFYEIFVGSFSDSDGDGIGDLRGIINRLDYLNDGDPASGKSLGIGGIWLTPIFLSPSYHKYDVTDYYKIDPSFGTMSDLEELIAACHQRGILVILDLVLNHTGSENRWFKNFKNSHAMKNTGNAHYDYYTYLPAGNTQPAGRHFARIGNTGEYYECNFSDNMPQLNYDNPAVRQEMLNVALYYLQLGVDGFRFDAGKYIYYGDHAKNEEFWQWYTEELKKVKPDIYTVAEVWDSDSVTDKYIPALNCFNFTLSQSSGLIATTAKQGNVNKFTAYIEKYIDHLLSLNENAFIVPFIANHDTDRSAGYLTQAAGHAQMAANLYILGPGSPFIYYGEELGIKGSRGGASTDANRRLRMLWGDGDTVRDPVGTDYDASKQIQSTAKDQLPDANSLYNYYKKLILIRSAHPEIACGTYRALDVQGSKAGGFTATLNGCSTTVIHNTTLNPVTLDLKNISGACYETLSAFIGMGSATLEDGMLTLDSHTSAVIR